MASVSHNHNIRFWSHPLASEEYLQNFGDNTVPYQRRRILPQRSQGALPFARMARYDRFHLKQVQALSPFRGMAPVVVDRSAAVYRKVLFLVPTASVAVLVATLILVIVPQ